MFIRAVTGMVIGTAIKPLVVAALYAIEALAKHSTFAGLTAQLLVSILLLTFVLGANTGYFISPYLFNFVLYLYCITVEMSSARGELARTLCSSTPTSSLSLPTTLLSRLSSNCDAHVAIPHAVTVHGPNRFSSLYILASETE